MEQGMLKFVVAETAGIMGMIEEAMRDHREISVQYIGDEYCCMIGDKSKPKMFVEKIPPSDELILEFIDTHCMTIGDNVVGKGLSTRGFVEKLNEWLDERGYEAVITRRVKPMLYNLGYPAGQGVATDTNSKTSVYKRLGWK